MGIPCTMWHFLPSCPWALSTGKKNQALCSGTVLNGGPEQFPREETERLIEWVQCVARFFPKGCVNKVAPQVEGNKLSITWHTYRVREIQTERERGRERHRYGVNERHRKLRPFVPGYSAMRLVQCHAFILWKWFQALIAEVVAVKKKYRTVTLASSEVSEYYSAIRWRCN